MKNPLCLQSNINWVWSLFHKGQSVNAVKAFNSLKSKIESGMIFKDNNLDLEFQKLERFVHLATGLVKIPSAPKLDLIAAACN